MPILIVGSLPCWGKYSCVLDDGGFDDYHYKRAAKTVLLRTPFSSDGSDRIEELKEIHALKTLMEKGTMEDRIEAIKYLISHKKSNLFLDKLTQLLGKESMARTLEEAMTYSWESDTALPLSKLYLVRQLLEKDAPEGRSIALTYLKSHQEGEAVLPILALLIDKEHIPEALHFHLYLKKENQLLGAKDIADSRE